MPPLLPSTASSSLKPASLGYRMPAEWIPHEATWLAWPRNPETWPGKRLVRVEEIYLQMLEALLPFEKVHLFVQNAQEEAAISERLQKRGIRTQNLFCHAFRTADAWVRDYGPTFVKNEKGEKAWIKWTFNAWGGKYEAIKEDNKVFAENRHLIPHPYFEADFVLEGGSIEVNGQGTVITTEQCLLHPNRNPQLSRSQIEQNLKDYLGVSQVIWLHEGLEGDDTDGHIDDMVRFVNETTIVSSYEEDEHDSNHRLLQDHWNRLRASHDPQGKAWNLIKLPMPGCPEDREGGRLPASYANFYIGNGAVLLPVFRHRNDERAAKILKELFPKREVVPIVCADLVYGMGAIHCVSQQEPA